MLRGLRHFIKKTTYMIRQGGYNVRSQENRRGIDKNGPVV